MIPQEKKEAVARALRESFGVAGFEDIAKMTAGLSKALVFRVIARGNPYLLRVIPDTDATIGPGQGDQTHHFTCMKLAAEAGIAPRVRYASPADGISITDFVETRLLPRTEALALLPAILRKLHALPPWPSSRVVNYFDRMDQLAQKFLAAGLLLANESAELSEVYAQTIRAYPRDGSETVSSHNDLRPENILFDGHRVWLVDWEAAFSNDRYLDLAVIANFVVTNAAEEETYLRTYFAEPASEYRHARLYLMTQLLHIFYAAFLMLFSCKGRPIGPLTNAPGFRDFHDGIRAGAIDLADEEKKLEYAKVHLNRLLANHRAARFQEALRIVSAA